MVWDVNGIVLGERVAGSWLARRSHTPLEYLAINGMGFLGDISTILGWSASAAERELDAVVAGRKQDEYLGVVAYPWPVSDPVTTLYVTAAHDAVREQLRRWRDAAVEFCHRGPGSMPVLLDLPVYAAHVGHVGQALAGLLAARASQDLLEIPTRFGWNLGIGPSYVLPSYRQLVQLSASRSQEK